MAATGFIRLKAWIGQAFIPDFTVFICENGQTYSYILNNQTNQQPDSSGKA